jgi:ABC-type transport system involved in multi-copper enzyme maturation permease subunit
MSRGILTTVSVFAIGIVAVVAGFFLLDIEKIALHFWTFGSLLFSLLVSLLAMITLAVSKRNRDGVFYAAGLGGAVWIYEIAVVISVLCINSFADRLNSFIFTQIAINAFFFIIAAVIVSVSERIHNNNAKTYDNLQNEEYNKPRRGGF